jgi:hypothetical protein
MPESRRWHRLTVKTEDGTVLGNVTRDREHRFPYRAACTSCAGNLSTAELGAALAYLTHPGHYDCPLHRDRGEA